jgi:hypothetical protein
MSSAYIEITQGTKMHYYFKLLVLASSGSGRVKIVANYLNRWIRKNGGPILM